MPKYQLTRPARSDIAEIRRYISRENREAAERVTHELFATLKMLADHPEIGHHREDITAKSVKFLSVRHYMVIYNPKSKPLIIYRVLSGYRDISSIL